MIKLTLVLSCVCVLHSCQKKTLEERNKIISDNVASKLAAEEREARAMHFLDSLETNDSILYEDAYEIIKQNIIDNY